MHSRNDYGFCGTALLVQWILTASQKNGIGNHFGLADCLFFVHLKNNSAPSMPLHAGWCCSSYNTACNKIRLESPARAKRRQTDKGSADSSFWVARQGGNIFFRVCWIAAWLLVVRSEKRYKDRKWAKWQQLQPVIRGLLGFFLYIL